MKTRQNLFGVMVAMLTGSLLLFSCAKEDNTATSPDISEEVVPEYPTEDQLITHNPHSTRNLRFQRYLYR